jgi:hypothetical protein
MAVLAVTAVCLEAVALGVAAVLEEEPSLLLQAVRAAQATMATAVRVRFMP